MLKVTTATWLPKNILIYIVIQCFFTISFETLYTITAAKRGLRRKLIHQTISLERNHKSIYNLLFTMEGSSSGIVLIRIRYLSSDIASSLGTKSTTLLIGLSKYFSSEHKGFPIGSRAPSDLRSLTFLTSLSSLG